MVNPFSAPIMDVANFLAWVQQVRDGGVFKYTIADTISQKKYTPRQKKYEYFPSAEEIWIFPLGRKNIVAQVVGW